MRIEDIYNAICDSKSISQDNIREIKNVAYTADDISAQTGYMRTAVSSDLNQLVKEKRVIKIKSRPTYYISKNIFADLLDINCLSEVYKSFDDLSQAISDCLEKKEKYEQALTLNPFMKMIGYNGSLKKLISKLTAAVLYPPNGLNIFLSGESGVGKTFLAETLHKYYETKSQSKVPFIYFNCAEYYNNPELLTAHLFGYKKGSFTGADGDSKGIIELADGGFLFLDEVHRLSSEGQEKLFTVLDKKYFTKLGDAETKNYVDVRFIFASTEDMKQNFLKTFLRRVPVVVEIPKLSQRSIVEKLQLIVLFFYLEAKRIDKNIYLSYDILKMLCFAQFDANVGELKSEIQFLTAEAYLEYYDIQTDEIKIQDTEHELNTDTEAKVEELISFNNRVSMQGLKIEKRRSIQDILHQLDVIPRKNDIFYDSLYNEYIAIQKSNLSTRDKILIMKNKIGQLYSMDLFNREVQTNLLDMDNTESMIVIQLCEYIKSEFQLDIDSRTRDIIKNHVILLNREHLKSYESLIKDMNHVYPENMIRYTKVKNLVDYLSELLGQTLPTTELVYFDLLIDKIDLSNSSAKENNHCGVVVIAHGSKTASSMVEYTNILFSRNVMRAIDMPINQTVDETLDCLRRLIKESKFQKLILIVDIGSLVYFGSVISKEFDIEVLLICDMNLLTLLELSREIIYESDEFDYLFPILKEKKQNIHLYKSGEENNSKVIVVTCLTGIGSALKVEKLLYKILPQNILSSTRIITLERNSVQDLQSLYKFIHDDEKIMGIISNSKINIPDIPLLLMNDLFSKKGIETVLDWLTINIDEQLREDIYYKYIQNISVEIISDMLDLINPQIISIELSKIYVDLCKLANIKFDGQQLLRFIVHCSCMIERQITNKEYDRVMYEMSYKTQPDMLSVIKMSFRNIEVSYGIDIAPLEIHYIYELLFDKS